TAWDVSGSMRSTFPALGAYTNIVPWESMLATTLGPNVSVGTDCALKLEICAIGVIQTWPVAAETMTTLLFERKTCGRFGGRGTVCVTVEVAGSTSWSLLSALSTSITVDAFWS